MLSKSDLENLGKENLTRSDLETLARLGYDRPTLLKLVAFDIERKGKYLLNLIEPGSATTPAKAARNASFGRQLAGGTGTAARSAKPAAKTNGKPPAPKTQGGKRTLTPEARANIIAAQKKRWAEYHSAQAVG